jgi:putative oxidoreductase
MKDIADLIGRIFLSTLFFFEAGDSSVYQEMTYKIMTKYGFTWQQDFLYYAAIAALSIGALLVLIGYRAGLGVFLILLYWVPFTFVVYSFWMAPTLEQQHSEAAMFLKHLSIIGGLLLMYANGAGKYSVKRLLSTTKVSKW